MGGICLADLFEGQHIGQRIHARAAIFFGNLDAHETQLAHFANGLQWELTAIVVFGRNGDDLVLGEFASGLAQHFVLFAEQAGGCGLVGDH